MSSIDRNNPFAPPEAVVADTIDPDEQVAGGQLAGRGARFWAAMLDGLLSCAITYAASRLLGIEWFSEHPSLAKLWPLYLCSFALFALVQGWFLHVRGQTLGKMALGIRIKRTDGSRAGVGRTMGLRVGVTWLVGAIPVAGPVLTFADVLFIFGKSRRCLHDFIANTIVVKA